MPPELARLPGGPLGPAGAAGRAARRRRHRARCGPGRARSRPIALLLVYAIVAISLLILTGWAGQISLGQFALVGFGGATTGVLYARHGWDYLAAAPGGHGRWPRWRRW